MTRATDRNIFKSSGYGVKKENKVLGNERRMEKLPVKVKNASMAAVWTSKLLRPGVVLENVTTS